jgi:hypothetical protein
MTMVRGPVTRLAITAAATAAAIAARRAAEICLKVATSAEPPTPRDLANDRELRDLLMWTGIVAVAVVIARKLATSKTEQLLGLKDD